MPKCNALENILCLNVGEVWVPCCAYLDTEQDRKYPLAEFSFSEYKNTPFYKKIVSDMSTDWNSGCLRCKKSEDSGLESARNIYSTLFTGTSNTVEHIELNLSTECNLYCRMCSTANSTTWNKVNEIIKFYPDKIKNETTGSINFDQLFSVVDLSKVRRLKLLGGEPFIVTQTQELFQYLDDRQLLENLEFTCNTNVTFYPKKLEPFLMKCRKVITIVSIDAVGALNDYVRAGSKWATVIDVLAHWKKFTQEHRSAIVASSTCLTPYNVHQIDLIKKFFVDHGIKSNSINFVDAPRQMSMSAVPNDYISYLIDVLSSGQDNDSYIRYLKSQIFNSDLCRKLKEFTVSLDNYSGMHLRDYVPRLADSLGL